VRIFQAKSFFLVGLIWISAVVAAPVAYAQKIGTGFERFAEEHRFALDLLQSLNERSVDLNYEYCGFIYYDTSGLLRATKPEKGGTHSCLPVFPEDSSAIFASYHTHAAYDPNSLNEYPSVQDMEGDFSNAINGYMATPGGRLWFTDAQKRLSRQLCGYRCLVFDPSYREDPRSRPKTVVNLNTLRQITDEKFAD